MLMIGFRTKLLRFIPYSFVMMQRLFFFFGYGVYKGTTGMGCSMTNMLVVDPWFYLLTTNMSVGRSVTHIQLTTFLAMASSLRNVQTG